jgi:hypothetical protein
MDEAARRKQQETVERSKAIRARLLEDWLERELTLGLCFTVRMKRATEQPHRLDTRDQ